MAGSSGAILRQTNAGFGVSAGASATAPTRTSRRHPSPAARARPTPAFDITTQCPAPALDGVLCVWGAGRDLWRRSTLGDGGCTRECGAPSQRRLHNVHDVLRGIMENYSKEFREWVPVVPTSSWRVACGLAAISVLLD